MDKIDSVIDQFRSSPEKRLGLIDSLYLALPDSRAFELLLAVATDASERDAVRSATWKVWSNTEPESEEDRERVLAAALFVVQSDAADLVRDHAICALTYHSDRADVESVLLPIMRDRAAGRSVRSAAFQVLSCRGRERREADFRLLADDPDLGEEIGIYFSLQAQRNTNRTPPA